VRTRGGKGLLTGPMALLILVLLAGPGEPADGLFKKKSVKKLRKEVVRQLRDGEVFAPEAFEAIPIAGDTGRISMRLPKRFRDSEAVDRLSELIRKRMREHSRPMRLLEGHQSTVPAIGDDFTKRVFLDQPAFQIVGRPAVLRNASGSGVVVAVLDSGVDRRHEMLRGRLLPGLDLLEKDRGPWEEANGVLEKDRGPWEEANGVDDDGDGRIDEGHGHGTFVAGLIAAMAPGARILPIRVLSDEGNGDSFGLADGIYWAVRSGADVISLSLGMRGSSPLVSTAAEYAERRGVVVICAAVVDRDGGFIHRPGGLPTVLSVTALDLLDRKPEWAAAHRKVGIAAPGVSIIGPWPGGGGRRYARGDGASFATAIVAGAAALVVGEHADLAPEQVRRVLTDAARDITDENPEEAGLLGAGRLDLAEIFR